MAQMTLHIAIDKSPLVDALILEAERNPKLAAEVLYLAQINDFVVCTVERGLIAVRLTDNALELYRGVLGILEV